MPTNPRRCAARTPLGYARWSSERKPIWSPRRSALIRATTPAGTLRASHASAGAAAGGERWARGDPGDTPAAHDLELGQAKQQRRERAHHQDGEDGDAAADQDAGGGGEGADSQRRG